MTSFSDWESGLYLAHHGIKGQKWGVRRYQNEDGTLTAEGREHYSWGKNDYQSLRSKRLNRKVQIESKKGTKLVSKLAKKYGNDVEKIINDKRMIRYDKKGKKLKDSLDRSIESDFQKQNYKTIKKMPTDSQFMSKARSMIPDDKFQELLDVKRKHHEDSRHMTKLQSADDYTKPGGVQKKIEEVATEMFGKKWRKLGYAKVHQIIDGAANETLEGAFRKTAFNNFKNALNSKGSEKERNKKILASINHDDSNRVVDHILQNKKANKLISDFWKEKTSKHMSSQEFDKLANTYAKQAARELGLPESKITYYFLKDWFFNGDD